MKKLNSFLFYLLVTPAITLGAGSVLAQQTTPPTTTQNDKNPQHAKPSEMQTNSDQQKARDQSGMQNRGYMGSVPANGSHATNLIGADVKTSTNEDIGSVSDLIIDSNGKIVAIVVGVGGFLGMGEKDVAISWSNVTKTGSGDDQQLQINGTREDLQAAPKFEKRK